MFNPHVVYPQRISPYEIEIMTDQSTGPQHQPNQKASFIQWLIIATVLITALSLLAVHLPERLKLLLVYAVVYGLISGGVLTTLAIKFGLSVKKTLILVIVCLTILGQSLVLYLSHQRYREMTLKQFKADQTSFAIDRVIATSEPPEDPKARKDYEQVLKQIREAKTERRKREKDLLKISSYLKHRISAIANLKAPWPHLFWFIELILCCLAVIWASRQVVRSDSNNTSTEKSIESKS